VSNYRFPTESWVNTWLSAAPDYFTFSIKVNRFITDYTRLKGEKALQLWNKFSKTLHRMNDYIDFWLFKMPPSFKYNLNNLKTLSEFFREIKLGNKAVLEFRDPSWWKIWESFFVQLMLQNFLALELSLITQFTLGYTDIRNGIDISTLKKNLISY
jgi:uncharacterized protein YecE (DUF72 family)